MRGPYTSLGSELSLRPQDTDFYRPSLMTFWLFSRVASQAFGVAQVQLAHQAFQNAR
jgi:hypothetical protein